jgi:hypothetical protein
MNDLVDYTRRPRSDRLAEILAGLHDDPAVLIVVNHPLWDEAGIGQNSHRRILQDLIRQYREHIHALELNGLRPSAENDSVFELACAHRLPAVSGGDRHGREPSSGLNLTNAAVFGEFVEQVRRDGRSDVLWMPQQKQVAAARLFRAVRDVVRDDPQHGMGWTHWDDRVFYTCDDGVTRPLSAIGDCGAATQILGRLVGSVQLLDRALTDPRLKAVTRWAAAEEE